MELFKRKELFMKVRLRRLLVILVVMAMVMPAGLAYAATDDSNLPDQEAQAAEVSSDVDETEASEPEAADEQTAEAPSEEGTLTDGQEIDPATLSSKRVGSDVDLDAIKEKAVQADKSGKITLEEIEAMDAKDLNTKVRVSIFMDAAPVLDKYTVKQVNQSKALSYRSNVRSKQIAVEKKINVAIGRKLNVKWHLTLAVNAISTEATYSEIAKILKVKGVNSVERERQYRAHEGTAEPQTSNTADQMTGATSAWSQGYTGAGTRIAIIDTGIDYEHQSFDPGAFMYAVNEVKTALDKDVDLMTAEDVAEKAEYLNVPGFYLNEKIPYAYNYKDKNTTINHVNDTEGEHGSHVAGIAAANRYIKVGDEYKDAMTEVYAVGMAPDAQILVMKVFGQGGGPYDSEYMAAVEDAITLECDTCNLSLGSSEPGFSFDSTYDAVFQNLSQNSDGMVAAVSAGNSGSWGADNSYYGEIYEDDVNFDTVGSPGSFTHSLTVAAAENLGVTGKPVIFDDAYAVYPTETGTSISTLANDDGYEYVYIDSFGEPEDYAAVDEAVSLKGKIVIVNRGGNYFYEKGNNLIDYEPAALIVANNTYGSISMSLDDFTGEFPMVSMTYMDAYIIKNYLAEGPSEAGDVQYYTGNALPTDVVNAEQTTEYEDAEMASFSSWGVPGSLLLKPDITAPGGNIYSVFGYNKTPKGAYTGGHDQYELMSGTSMAAPHIAGLSAVLLQYLKEKGAENLNAELAGNYTDRAIAQSLIMSTAVPMKPDGYLSVFQQGAGLADVSKAINASSVVMMNDACLTTYTGSAEDGKVKVELGEDPDKTGKYSYSFTIYNTSDVAEEFELSTDMFTQDKDEYYDEDLEFNAKFLSDYTKDIRSKVNYSWESEISFNDHDVDKDGDTDAADAQAVLDYLTGENDGTELDLEKGEMDGIDGLSSQDAKLILEWKPEGYESGYVIPAGGKAKVTVNVNITEDLSDYENGAYIEGYTYAKCITVTDEGKSLETEHSIPVLGFYGNWTDASMFDKLSTYDVMYDMMYDEEKALIDIMPLFGGDAVNTYTGNVFTNMITIRHNGEENPYVANPYYVEEEFPADRLAITSDTEIVDFYYNLIRPASAIGIVAGAVDENGELAGDPFYAQIVAEAQSGAYYDETYGPQEYNTRIRNFGKTAESFGLKEGDKFTVGLYAVPEYYAMLINAAYDPDGSMNHGYSGTLYDENDLLDMIDAGMLGDGAYIKYNLTVDDTKPVIESVTFDKETQTVNVKASDNLNIAGIQVLDLTGEEAYAAEAPAAPTADVTLDVSEAVEMADGFVAVRVGDYAGNEVAVALKVNDNDDFDPYEVQEVILNPSEMNLFKGQTRSIDVKVLPITAEDKEVIWESDNEAAATVSETGAVTGVDTGTATITAKSKSNPDAIVGECKVNVLVISKDLSAVLWDEDGAAWYTDFNTEDVSAYKKNVESSNIASTIYNHYGNLISGNLDTQEWASELFLTDPETYEETPLGTNYAGAFDTAYALDNPYYDDEGNLVVDSYFAYAYGPYLIMGNLMPEVDEEDGNEYTGIPYILGAFGDAGDNTTYIGALAYKGESVEYDGEVYANVWPSFYFADQQGNIWYTVLDDEGAEFSEPELVASTGVSTTFFFQSLYYDGEFIYWSSYDDGDYVNLYIIDPETGDVFSAGDFGESVWPVSGVYEQDAVSGDPVNARKPDKQTLAKIYKEKGLTKALQSRKGDIEIDRETVEKNLEKELKKLDSRKFAVTEAEEEAEVNEMITEPEVTEEPVVTDEPETVDTEEPAGNENVTSDEPEVVTPEAEPGDEPADPEEGDLNEEEPSGSLNAVIADRAVTNKGTVRIKEDGKESSALKAAAGVSEDADIVDVIDDVDTTNGLFTITYDPAKLVYKDTVTGFSVNSVHADKEVGKITFAYAGTKACPAGDVIASVIFEEVCLDDEVTLATKERNDQLTLTEESTVTVTGAGHIWGEPTYKWSSDMKTVTATVVCERDENHTETETADVVSETTAPTCTKDGKTVYTAEFSKDPFETQVKETVIKATGHKYREYKLTRKATTKESGKITRTCEACGKKDVKVVAPVINKAVSLSTTKAKITWNKVTGAQRYLVYFGTCGKHTIKKAATTTGTSYIKTKLVKGKYYRAKVYAQRKIGGKWTTISQGFDTHFVSGNLTKNKKITNTKSLSVTQTAVTLKAGKTSAIKAKATGVKAKKTILAKSHCALYRYLSTNTDVATVSSKGVITAKAKGTCNVYVIAPNGVSKAVKVTVN